MIRFLQRSMEKTVQPKVGIHLGFVGLLTAVLSVFVSTLAMGQAWRVVTENAPPLQYITESGVAGYSTDMVKTLLAEVNLQVDIDVLPWARGFDLALQRKNTLIYSMIRTPQREAHFQWIGRLGHFQLSFVGLKHRKGLQIKSIEEAKKWVVGAMRDDYTHQFLRQHGFSNEQDLVVRSQLSELVDLLYKEKIDTFIVDVVMLRPMVQELGFDEGMLKSLLTINELQGDVYLAANVNSDATMVATMKTKFKLLYGNRTKQQRFLMPDTKELHNR